MKCEICDIELRNFNCLSKHIRFCHKDETSKGYYDKFLKKETCGICVICGQETKWRNINDGYQVTCGHKCGCTYHRYNLKNNEEKMKLFVQKVMKNQTRIWDERKLSGEKEIIIEKVSLKNKQNIYKMSREERVKRFGWLNKLSPIEKEERIKYILEKSLLKFFREATDDEKRKVIEKRIETRIKNGTMSDPNIGIEFIDYQRRVRSKSNINYRKFKEELDPNNLRGIKYHLDHKVSILFGFINNIPEEIISHILNLEVLPSKINLCKHADCSIDINELLSSIGKYNEQITYCE